MNPSLRQAAFQYYEQGLTPIPVRGKKALTGWKEFQDRRPSPAELTDLLNKRGATGLAILLGPVSGNLYCRDWDELSAYEDWASSHPDIAELSPTAQSPHGFHTYFHSDQHLTTTFCGDGELRGYGGYIVAPPTTNYRWTIPFEPSQLLTLDPVIAGFSKKYNSRATHLPLKHSLSSSALSDLSVISVTLIVERATPTQPGENHRLLFELARGIRTLEHQQDKKLSPAEQSAIFDQWYEQAEPFLRLTYDDYKVEFLNSLDGVKHLITENPVILAWERAQILIPPEIAQQLFRSAETWLLVSLCRELQRAAGDNPFFLSCRTVQSLFQHSEPMKAWRWLRALEKAGILQSVEVGSTDTYLATRFRYLHPLDDKEGAGS